MQMMKCLDAVLEDGEKGRGEEVKETSILPTYCDSLLSAAIAETSPFEATIAKAGLQIAIW
jgi:hypothetical protein